MVWFVSKNEDYIFLKFWSALSTEPIRLHICRLRFVLYFMPGLITLSASLSLITAHNVRSFKNCEHIQQITGDVIYQAKLKINIFLPLHVKNFDLTSSVEFINFNDFTTNTSFSVPNSSSTFYTDLNKWRPILP